jgi:hypothetical protein
LPKVYVLTSEKPPNCLPKAPRLSSKNSWQAIDAESMGFLRGAKSPQIIVIGPLFISLAYFCIMLLAIKGVEETKDVLAGNNSVAYYHKEGSS